MIRNRAGQSIGAELVDATTGAAFVGAVTCYVTIDAGVQAVGTVGGGACAAEGNGLYTYRPSQAETNGAAIDYTFVGTGAVTATIPVATGTPIGPAPLLRNTAGQSVSGQLIDATTGAAFAGVVTVYVTIDAGTQAIGSVGAGLCTAEGNGLYTYRPARAETDGAALAFTFVGTGAIPVNAWIETIAATALVSSDTTLNARSLITDALIDLGVLEPGDALSAADGALGLRTLNKFIGLLQTQNLTFPFLNREVFPIVANQGSYTIGPGGDFDTVRPQRLSGAAWLAPTTGATTGRLEVAVAVLTDAEWASLALKEMTNSLWTAVHYSATYTDGLGTIELWPVPNTDLNALVLYRGDMIQGFANLNTFYDIPPGYAELLQFNLEKRLCRVYGTAREWGALDDELARDALRLVKRQNFKLQDAALDQTMNRGTGRYSIEIGGYR